MKKMKKFLAFALCLLMLSAMVLSGCSNEGDKTDSKDAAYKVTVVDGVGNPYTGKVIVKFKQNGAQVAMMNVNDKGVAEKTLPKGEYTVELDAIGDFECHYEPVTLTADKTEAKVTMAFKPGEKKETFFAPSFKSEDYLEFTAPVIGAGSTYVPLEQGDRNYVLFSATEAGEYEFSVTGDVAEIGYYGITSVVQPNNLATKDGNTFKMEIIDSMIGSGDTFANVIVLGLDPKEGAEGAIVNIIRQGDIAWSIEQASWTVYEPKVEPTPFTLPEGTLLSSFDITLPTDTYKLVLNEEDGCYHLDTADGPMVYVHLEKELYYVSMLDMVGEIKYDEDGILIPGGHAPIRYVYNNGQDDYLKEDYTDAMKQFVTCRDPKTGVYPLTEDLYYMLKMGISYSGWCEANNPNYLFGEVPNVNHNISWMFLFCYAV